MCARDYALPPWTTPDATVLCSSYSGDTEETLAAYEAAGAVGARRIVCTTGGQLAQAARGDGVPVIPLPGGYQPRVAVGYGLVVALEVAALAGVAESLHTEIDVAAAHAEQLAARLGARRRRGLARQAACALAARHDPADHRRRTDGFDRLPLEDAVQREREDAVLRGRAARVRPQRDRRLGRRGRRPVQRRAARRLRPASPRADADRFDRGPRSSPTRPSSSASQSIGETRVERLVSLVLLGDLVSLYAAILRGVDPGQVDALSNLKAALAEIDAPELAGT